MKTASSMAIAAVMIAIQATPASAQDCASYGALAYEVMLERQDGAKGGELLRKYIDTPLYEGKHDREAAAIIRLAYEYPRQMNPENRVRLAEIYRDEITQSCEQGVKLAPGK